MDKVSKDIIQHVQGSFQDSQELSKELGLSYLGYIEGSIRELRGFLRDIAFLAGGILAATAIFTETIYSKPRFYVGVALLLSVIYVAVRYTAEVLGDEIKNLFGQLKNYQTLLAQRMNMDVKFLTKGDFSVQSFSDYQKGVNDFLPYLKSELAKMNKKERQDAILPFLTFLLTTGTTLIIFSASNINLGIYWTCGIVIVTFVLSFLLPIRKFMELIAKPLIWFEKKKESPD